jgi:predicted transcriptional regulator of viral defense system
MQCMPRYAVIAPLSEMAEEQWGFVTRKQALGLGLSRRSWERLAAESGYLEKVAHGVYRLRGAPPPDHEQLRAAWLQLAPDVPVWERVEQQGVVSHRSAADMYGVGHLPEERHEFTIAMRHQSRRPDVRLHRRKLSDTEWIILRGLPVTRPSRIASDLLYDHEDPTGVAHIISDSLRNVYDYPSMFAESLGVHAPKFRLRRGDGIALLKELLDLVGDPETDFWMSEARASVGRDFDKERAPATVGGNPLR